MFNSINHQDQNGNTALMHAAIMTPRVSLSMVTDLVDSGADLNKQNNYGNTALILAAMVNNHDTVSFLLERGANVSLRNEEGLSFGDIMNERTREYQQILNMLH